MLMEQGGAAVRALKRIGYDGPITTIKGDMDGCF